MKKRRSGWSPFYFVLKVNIKEYFMKKRLGYAVYMLQVILLIQLVIPVAAASVQVTVLDTHSGKQVDSAIVEVRQAGEFIASVRSSAAGSVTIDLSGSGVKDGGGLLMNSPHVYLDEAYPNPATNLVHFELYLQNYLSELQVNIYNILGQRISSEKLNNLFADNYQLLLDASCLASSVYFVELISSQGERATAKFVKIGNYSFSSIPEIAFRRTGAARQPHKNTTAPTREILGKSSQDNEYTFQVFTDEKSKIYDTDNRPSVPNDIEEGWVGVFGYVTETREITGDVSVALEMDVNYRAPRAATAPVIDGVGSEDCWQQAVWAPIDHLWLFTPPSVDDFSGRYKMIWTPDSLYYLVEITDNVLNDYWGNPLQNYYMDDCLEFFIDEDHSGGFHYRFPSEYYNAFAYHISIFYDVVDTEGLYNDHIHILRTNPEANKYIWEAAVVIYDSSFVYGGSNTPVTLTAGKEMGFAIAYCDNDGGDNRESFIGSIFVDGNPAYENGAKNSAWQNADVFATLELVDEE
jgi:hypothetical protein